MFTKYINIEYVLNGKKKRKKKRKEEEEETERKNKEEEEEEENYCYYRYVNKVKGLLNLCISIFFS